MIGRWLLALRSDTRIFLYAGKRPDGSVWVQKKNSATKFVTREQAESFGLLLTTEEPEIIGKVEVVPYEEALEAKKAGEPSSVDGGQAGR